tara:strand:+ start:4213 stop:4497 length:285 start_codon:yes stop_codon:yes gene_type:complete
MNQFLELIESLTKTNLQLEMSHLQVVVTCSNGAKLSIIANGYGCQDGLLELMCISEPAWWERHSPHGFLTADQAMLIIQMYGGLEDETYIGEEE